MSVEKFTNLKLSAEEAKKYLIQNLRTRPNNAGYYGEKGLSGNELRKKFDEYPEALRSKLNDLIDAIVELYTSTGEDGSPITNDIVLYRKGEKDITLAMLAKAIFDNDLDRLTEIEPTDGTVTEAKLSEDLLNKLNEAIENASQANDKADGAKNTVEAAYETADKAALDASKALSDAKVAKNKAEEALSYFGQFHPTKRIVPAMGTDIFDKFRIREDAEIDPNYGGVAVHPYSISYRKKEGWCVADPQFYYRTWGDYEEGNYVEGYDSNIINVGTTYAITVDLPSDYTGELPYLFEGECDVNEDIPEENYKSFFTGSIVVTAWFNDYAEYYSGGVMFPLICYPAEAKVTVTSSRMDLIPNSDYYITNLLTEGLNLSIGFPYSASDVSHVGESITFNFATGDTAHLVIDTTNTTDLDFAPSPNSVVEINGKYCIIGVEDGAPKYGWNLIVREVEAS